LLASLQSTRRLFGLGAGTFPGIFTSASGAVTAVRELGRGKRTAGKECLGNAGLKAWLSFCVGRIDARGFI